MYGEVYVPYTGIGGMNMDSGIMPADLTGSTDGNNVDTEGEKPLQFTIRWSLPGGMVDKGKTTPQGAWGFITGRDSQEGSWGDQEFIQYLNSVYGFKISEDGTLSDLSEEAMVINTINTLCYKYAKRVIANDGLSEDYNWGAMNRFYQGCFDF